MKPCFQLWDSDTANLVGTYESVPDVVEDLKRTSTTPETREQIKDLVLTLGLGGSDGDSMVILDGAALYLLGTENLATTAN